MTAIDLDRIRSGALSLPIKWPVKWPQIGNLNWSPYWSQLKALGWQVVKQIRSQPDAVRILVLAALLVASLALSISLLLFFARGQDDVKRQSAVQVAETGLAVAMSNLSQTTRDYAHWDQSVANLIYHFNPDWAAENIGRYMFDIFGVSTITVIDHKNAVPYHTHLDAEETEQSATQPIGSMEVLSQKLTGGLEALVARAREATTPEQPGSAVGFMVEGDTTYMLGVSAIVSDLNVPEDYSELIRDHRVPVMIFGMPISQAFLTDLSESYQLDGLRLAQHPGSDANLPLVAPDGSEIGYLSWNVALPSSSFSASVYPPVLSAIACIALLAAYLLMAVARNAQATADAAAARTSYLTDMSQQLRTPLRAVIGSTETMLKQPFGPIGHEKYKEYVEDIRRNEMHILNVMSDFHDLSKIEAGEFPLEEKPVRLKSMVEAARKAVRERAKAAKVTLSVKIEPEITEVRADESAMKRMIANLLSNAISSMPEGGRVSVNAKRTDDGSLALSVADTGTGMDKTRIRALLAPFHHGGSGLGSIQEGAGLGLPITKALAEMHRGTLAIDSAIDHGTTATITLPADRLIAA